MGARAPARTVASWWQTSGQLLLGFGLLSALVLWRAPGALIAPARAISAHPWRTLLIGLLVAQFFLVVPLASGLLLVATAVFWGWFPGVLLGVGLLAAFGLLWFLSPLVTGVWLGRRAGVALGRGADSLPLLVGGVLLLALLGQLPTVGWVIYLISFVLALGALVESVGRPPRPRSAPECGRARAHRPGDRPRPGPCPPPSRRPPPTPRPWPPPPRSRRPPPSRRQPPRPPPLSSTRRPRPPPVSTPQTSRTSQTPPGRADAPYTMG